MKKVYVAGPYGSDESKIPENISRAQKVARAIGTLGGRVIPVVPHNLGIGFSEVGDREYWLAATMEILCFCDCLVAMDGFEASFGSRHEVKKAMRIGIPVVYARPDWTDDDYRREVEAALFRWGAK